MHLDPSLAKGFIDFDPWWLLNAGQTTVAVGNVGLIMARWYMCTPETCLSTGARSHHRAFPKEAAQGKEQSSSACRAQGPRPDLKEIRTGRPDLLRASRQEVTKGRVSPPDPSAAESDPLPVCHTVLFTGTQQGVRRGIMTE